jgi:transposase
MGDKYLRRLLINGMTSIIARNAYRPGLADARVTALLARKPLRVATVAMANHSARAIWAIMTRGENYRAPTAREVVAA